MTRSFAMGAYLAASRALGPLAQLLLRRRMRRGKEDPARLGERLGIGGHMRPEGPLIWLHGASVGEVMSLLPLVDALLAGDRDATCLITSGTVTSARRVAEMLPDRALHQFVPVDTARAVRGFLDHWHPDLAIWVESELWPRLVVETAARCTPMMMVNARISAESAAQWARVPAMARQLVRCFDRIVTQDAETVARLTAMGAGAVHHGGNLKALAPVPVADPARLSALREMIGARAVWLAASTHPGEEEIVLAAHRAIFGDPLLILAPRHPERGEALADMIRDAGLRHVRLSQDTPDPAAQVWLADTLGDMGVWLRLAPITFVGGSLVETGGHTPFEPASLGSAILHGPHVANFAPAYAALRGQEGAISVINADDLAAGVAHLIADPTARGALVEASGVLRDLAPDPAVLAADALTLMRRRGG